MKKLTYVMALLAISVMSFAQGKITYVLNGGITNEYGWTCPQEMFDTLTADIDAFLGATNQWTKLSDYDPTDPTKGPTASGKTISGVTYATDVVNKFTEFIAADGRFMSHFDWLLSYMDAVAGAAGKAAKDLPSANSTSFRTALDCFFADGNKSGWQNVGNYTVAGVNSYEAYKDYWKGGFAGPAEYAEGNTIILEAYKPYPANPAEESFLGWYKDEACTEEITQIDGTGDVTVYAKFGEYIPSTIEVAAMADDTETKVGGTVSRVCGAEFWIQDAKGGLMCYQSSHNLVAGEEVILKGTKVTYGGIAELKNITVESKKDGKAVTPQVVLLSDILGDTIDGKYTSELVRVEGVRVKYVESTDSKGNTHVNPTLYDGDIEVPCYKITLDQTLVPEGSKVSANLIVSEYNGTKQLRGLAEDFTVAAAAGKDTYDYPVVTDTITGQNVKYTLTNNWLYSRKLGNWTENRPNPLAEGTRSILQKDGIIYFAYRESNGPVNPPYIARVDVKTGEMLSPVYFADSLMKVDGTYIFGAFSDMKMDNEGHVITSSLPTSGGDFQIWTVDLETGGGSLLIDMTAEGKHLADLFPEATYGTIRIDRIGVYGDITKDAIVMAIVASGARAFYWEISEGEWDGETYPITLAIDGTVGGAPTICPIADNYFYVDGNETYPILFDPDGNVVDNLGDYPELLLNRSGNSHSNGNCGVLEIEVPNPATEDGFDYYFICAGDAHGVGAPAPTCFLLYKFKNKDRLFGEMQKLYEFPHAGLGDESNPQRVAVPYATVAEDGKSIEIYIFGAENGYGVYTLHIGDNAGTDTGLENVGAEKANVQKVVRDGQVVIIRDGVEYNVLGAQVK